MSNTETTATTRNFKLPSPTTDLIVKVEQAPNPNAHHAPSPGTLRVHARVEGRRKDNGNKVLLNLFIYETSTAAARVRILTQCEADGIDVTEVGAYFIEDAAS